jgi:hypothetical protein
MHNLRCEKMWATSVIFKIPAQSKQSSIGRKFGQSGHPGYILADFFTNSSGHPVLQRQLNRVDHLSRLRGDQIFAQVGNCLLQAVNWKLQKYRTYLGYLLYSMDKYRHKFWQKWIGPPFGRFFPNSSGHPARPIAIHATSRHQSRRDVTSHAAHWTP